MSDLFDLIEKVAADRKNQKGKYTNRQFIVDMLREALKHNAAMTFSNGDIRIMATRLGQSNTLSGVRQNIAELIMVGELEFVGREMRPNNVGFKSSVPVYRAVADA